MKKAIFIFILGMLIISQLGIIAADGGYIPQPGYWVRPGMQRAIIFHENDIETMIVTSGFQGNAKDLVWVIPTPDKPEITKANEVIFDNIQKLTQPKINYGNQGIGIMEAAKGGADRPVTVVERLKVDYYDVTILSAVNSEGLVEWLNLNGYEFPKEYTYVVQHYIDKEWYFTAIRISPEAANSKEVYQDLQEGHPTPVKLVFLSEDVVFPLKISAVDIPQDYYIAEGENAETAPDYYYPYQTSVPINIWIIADDKYEADRFTQQYGNWHTDKEIRKLGTDDSGNPLIDPEESKYFITALTANYQKSQMDDDVYFRTAEDNQKVNAGPEIYELVLSGLVIGLIIFLSWILTPMGIIFIIGIFILFLSQNNTARAISWIMQGISFVISLAIFLLVLFLMIRTRTPMNYASISIIVTSLVILGLMGFLIAIELRHKPISKKK